MVKPFLTGMYEVLIQLVSVDEIRVTKFERLSIRVVSEDTTRGIGLIKKFDNITMA